MNQFVPTDDEILGGLDKVWPNPSNNPGQVQATVEVLLACDFTELFTSGENARFFTKETGAIRHTVAIFPTGNWDYSVDGLYSGFAVQELRNVL